MKTEVPTFTWLFTEILSLHTFMCETAKCLRCEYFKVSKVIVTDSEVTTEDAALKWRGFLKRHVEYSWSSGATTSGRKQEFLLSHPPNHYIWHICCSFFVCWLGDWMNEWTDDFDSIIACTENTEYIQIIYQNLTSGNLKKPGECFNFTKSQERISEPKNKWKL